MMLWAKRKIKGGIVIETLFFLCALALLSQAFTAGKSTYRLMGVGEIATNGMITGIENHGFSLDIQYTPDVGNSVVFQQNGFLFNYRMGQQVSVIYDPANTMNARMKIFSALWWKSILGVLFGSIFLIIGLRMRSARSL